MRRTTALFLLAATSLLLLAGMAHAADAPKTGTIDVVELAGVLDRPLMAYALDRLDQAEREGARLLVFQVDSIGGVKVSPAGNEPELVRRVLNSTIPVVVNIGPRRAHAGGAAMFLAAAAHVASIGPSGRVYNPFPLDSAHPGPSATLKETYGRLASVRGRTTTLDGPFPLGANDALAAGLVDLVSPSLPDLFKRLQGRTLRTPHGPMVLDLPEKGVDVRFHQPGPVRRLLHALADPALLYLLLMGAAMLAVFEIFQRGFGIAGGTAIFLGVGALYGLSVLPVTILGGGLLAVGLLLLTFDVIRNELLWPSWIGLAAFTGGSVTWLPGGQDALRLSPWMVGTGAVWTFLFFVPIMTFVRRAAAPIPVSSEVTEQLIGGTGMVRSMLNPEGYVQVSGEMWRARSVDGVRVRVGENVIVSGIEGTTLIVQSGTPSPDA